MFPFMPAPAFSPNLPCTCFPPLPLPCPHPHQDTGIVSPLLTTPIPLGSLDRPCQMGTKTLPFPTQLLQQQCENKCQGYDTLGATRGSQDEGRFVYCGQRLVIFPGKGFLGVWGGFYADIWLGKMQMTFLSCSNSKGLWKRGPGSKNARSGG